MQDRTLILTTLLASLILLSISVSPSIAFVYPDGSKDNKFEPFGPRVDKVIIKKYANFSTEMQALQNGEIDLTDMCLDKTWIDTFKTDPNVTMSTYGGERGYYTMNFNNNDGEYLGSPEDPQYPNPVYPNPMSEPTMRQACNYLIDRVTLCSGQNADMYEPIFTPIPAYMTYWIHPDIKLGGTLENLTYPFDPTYSIPAALLENGGFPMGPGGWRYWDRNTNGVCDAGESLNITIYSRTHVLRENAADMLCAGFDDPAIKINYTRIECTGGVAWQKCMVEKDYHMYTAGWIYIGPDPDYLYDLYHWDNYYHPEDPPNFGAISKHDPIMQEYLEETKFAATSDDALVAVLAFQERFAEFACECPLASTSSPKAFSKCYTGGNDGVIIGDSEDKYRGQAWTQIANEASQGEDSMYTTLNAYPEGTEYGDGNMIIRYGWSDNTMPHTLNPLSSSWYWEGQVLDRIYEGLLSRNPATQGPSNSYSIVQNWTLGTWTDPRDGKNYSKVTVVIRPGIFWSDGVQFTIDDVIYSIYELPEKLYREGPIGPFPPPVEGFRKLDEYSVEFLMNVETYLAPSIIDRSWLGPPLIPKHIWQPYIATHSQPEFMGDLSGHPELLVGTGPFVFTENTADTLTLVKNLYFCQRMSTAVMRFDEQGYRHGVAVTALTPSTQITPFKIQADSNSLGHACITVPVENLDTDDECYIHEKIELEYPNATVVVLKDETALNIQPTEMLSETLSLVDFDRGKYTVKVTVEIVGGPLYEWVIADLPSELWPSILGPKAIEQSFWVTTQGDIDSNCVVDIFDIVVVATVFGSTIGHNNFNGSADLNGDCIVDIFDIVTIATWFGWGQ